jgi:predicted deacylase
MPSPSIATDYPVELAIPDIAPYRSGNCGIPFAWSFASGAPGPHLLITALVHGNEPAGAVALDWLMQRNVRPACGTLTLAFVNIDAYLRFDPGDPNATRWVDEDFNRLWAEEVLEGPRDSAELVRARELRPLVASADFLLDIHTMQHSAPPVMMAGWLDKGVELARRIGVPKLIVMDRGHAAGLRMRDHGAFGDPSRMNAAALVECGQHWAAASGALAIQACARFLFALGAAGGELCEAAGCRAAPEPQSVWRVSDAVTVGSDTFAFAAPFIGGEILPRAGALIARDGGREIRTPYDDCMLVMPSRRLWRGQTAIRLARKES